MTINKAQGQTFARVGLYVAFSRVRTLNSIRVKLNPRNRMEVGQSKQDSCLYPMSQLTRKFHAEAQSGHRSRIEVGRSKMDNCLYPMSQFTWKFYAEVQSGHRSRIDLVQSKNF
ncbi:hypothetical protein LAZ67_15003232 [Cordylochernes scorpioides]|uniref:Uncharacterized protein n=1 Tax=Cordylochernes scorpioides TaxID=51811 RepID=A0ABY6LAZ7_9ARAC|nr:hypothetical protein LAZ67_15003232 [Cordylochernes scorpioides]